MPHDLSTLNSRFGDDPYGALGFALSGAMGQVALVSSFGAESAVLLHMVARLEPGTPVIFIDTLLLFPETLTYQRDLARLLGLSDVRRVGPELLDLFREDTDSLLHRSNPDACCALRKARPLRRALEGFDGWISGRKRFQSRQRANLGLFERDPGTGLVKLNPLAGFTPGDLADYLRRHDLPQHPRVAEGYRSIGCMPCTDAVAPGEDLRAGRWRGLAKAECGIHGGDGQVSRRRAS